MSDWGVYRLRYAAPHVIPENDLRLHLDIPGCWCGPTDDDGVYVHHALDRREPYEAKAGAS